MTTKPPPAATALACLLLAPLVLHAARAAQTQQPPPAAPKPRPSKTEPAQPPKTTAPTPAPADPAEAERRVRATALLNALADDARDFREPALRARVQSQAADLLWPSDPVRARTLFRRAWEAARAGDRENERRRDEDVQRQLRAGGVATHANLPNLRAEVLGLAGRRERALAEEFFKSLEVELPEEEDQPGGGDGGAAPRGRPRRGGNSYQETTPAESQRLKLAYEFLNAGDADLALQTVTPALGRVTTDGINFLSYLRDKQPAEADRLYAALLARAAEDPNSDANTVSLLSSYVLTPGVVVTVMSGGGSTVQVGNSSPRAAPNPPLRAAFFRAAAHVLLRPLPPPAEDRTTAGRVGTYYIASRLLPLFERHAPDHAALLSARIAALRQEIPQSRQAVSRDVLTWGLEPPAEPDRPGVRRPSRVPEGFQAAAEESADDMVARIDAAVLRGASSDERERMYVEAAMRLGQRGEVRARELADRVEDADLRRGLREYVDFDLARGARARGDAAAALELVRTGELSPLRRVYLLTEAARSLEKTDPARALLLAEEAGAEARRAEVGDPARAQALAAVATRLFDLDPTRAWGVMGEMVKAANSAEEYRGQDGRMFVELKTKGMATASEHPAPEFDLSGLFGRLAADDLDRAADFARDFQHESPRAAATLAIARAVLEKKPGARR